MKLGRLCDNLLAFLEKKPLFLVEKDGYPLISSLFACAEAHVTLLLLVPPLALKGNSPPYGFRGLDFPLTLSNGVVSPGLDQPPPLLGEGDRDKDISAAGVPGMGGNG